MIFIDSNILIDIFDPGDVQWSGWSQQKLAELPGPFVINHVVFAEVSVRFAHLGQVQVFLAEIGVAIAHLTEGAAFLAAKAHARYRERGGLRETIIADFLIGAHASVLGAGLLTRDRQRFASYFPELTLITPETDHG